jgi:hypothetical protein
MPRATRTAKSTTTTSITRREFFAAVRDRLQVILPAELQGIRFWANHRQMKLYYGHQRLHYEIWTNGRDQHIEIGLHFENGPESTESLIHFFDQHIVEIKHELGPEIELERWTNSWGRIFLLLPYQPLTEDLAVEVADRLQRMISVLQPLLNEAIQHGRAGVSA